MLKRRIQKIYNLKYKTRQLAAGKHRSTPTTLNYIMAHSF